MAEYQLISLLRIKAFSCLVSSLWHLTGTEVWTQLVHDLSTTKLKAATIMMLITLTVTWRAVKVFDCCHGAEGILWSGVSSIENSQNYAPAMKYAKSLT
jgi:hypothetical protein